MTVRRQIDRSIRRCRARRRVRVSYTGLWLIARACDRPVWPHRWFVDYRPDAVVDAPARAWRQTATIAPTPNLLPNIQSP